MMRVYLMADEGGASLKALRTCFATHYAATQFGAPGYHVTLRTRNRLDAARAWWLVEAESADAARLTIKATQAHDLEGREFSDDQRRVFAKVGGGRILASGGAK